MVKIQIKIIFTTVIVPVEYWNIPEEEEEEMEECERLEIDQLVSAFCLFQTWSTIALSIKASVL